MDPAAVGVQQHTSSCSAHLCPPRPHLYRRDPVRRARLHPRQAAWRQQRRRGRGPRGQHEPQPAADDVVARRRAGAAAAGCGGAAAAAAGPACCEHSSHGRSWRRRPPCCGCMRRGAWPGIARRLCACSCLTCPAVDAAAHTAAARAEEGGWCCGTACGSARCSFIVRDVHQFLNPAAPPARQHEGTRQDTREEKHHHTHTCRAM